jgi:DNA-binding HxlR family transcriptional regulator
MNELLWDDAESLSPRLLTANLDENVRALFLQVCSLDGACALLRLLNSTANSVLTADDIAYHLKQAQAVVERNLRKLVELGWVRRLDLPDCTWFGLTTDPQRRKVVRELVAWQDRWFARLERMKHLINGILVQP